LRTEKNTNYLNLYTHLCTVKNYYNPYKLISGLTAQGRGSTLSGFRRHRPAGGCWGVSPWGGEMDKQLRDSLQHIRG